MTEKFVNRVSTTLNGALSSSTPGASEVIALVSVTGLPTTGEFRLLIEAEIVKVTSVNVGANTVTGLRGSEGTTAAAHLTGKTATMVVTAGGLGQLATDTLARIAATTPLSVALNGSGDPTLAIQAADATHNGYFSSTDWTKLNGVAALAQVNVLESVTGTAPISVAAVSGKNQAISIAAASGAAAGSMSAAHYTLVNGATDAATASALAKRDANGDVTFRFVNSTRLLQTTDDNLAANPQRIYGKQAADNYLRTFNAANITVGAATALAAGTDRNFIDRLNYVQEVTLGGDLGFSSSGLIPLTLTLDANFTGATAVEVTAHALCGNTVGAATFQCAIRKNGGGETNSSQFSTGGSNQYFTLHTTAVIAAAVGDIIDIQIGTGTVANSLVKANGTNPFGTPGMTRLRVRRLR